MLKKKHKILWMAAFLTFAPFALTGFQIKNGVTQEKEIRWHKDRRLTWDDFKAKPDKLSPMDALTESGLSFAWSCDQRGFIAEIYAMFIPSGSWVKNPTPVLLEHELGHFDITEIHARKMRRFFADHRNPCSLGKSGIDKAAKAITDASYAMQKVYDKETNHGENNEAHAQWLLRIEKQLGELAAWAQ